MTQTDKIIASLTQLGNLERASKSDTMCPTGMRVLGITNPDLKSVVKRFHVENRKESKDFFVSIAKELVDSRIFECQMFAWTLLDKAKLVNSLTKEEAISLEGTLDNWASVDTYGVLIFGVLWRIGTIPDKDVLNLQTSDNFWYRRLALVGTVALNLRSRGGKGDSERTINICRNAVTDHHDMVVKALSWALRSLIFWDREAVLSFLDEHYETLHKRVLREVNHKLHHGTKN